MGVLLPFGDKIMKECPRLKTAAPFAMISDLCCDMKSPINLKIAQLVIKTTSKMYFIYCFWEDIVQKGRTFYCVDDNNCYLRIRIIKTKYEYCEDNCPGGGDGRTQEML